MIGARLRRPFASALAVTAVLFGIQVAAAPAAGAATWTTQLSGTTAALSGVSCPTVYTCYASGDGGTILRTVDAGTTWTTVRTGGYSVSDISCATATTCWATALYDLVTTNDGGATWSVSYNHSYPLYAVSCATASTCLAVGYRGTVLRTANAGAMWTAGASGTANDLLTVECPTAATCYAGGYGGTVVASTDGGLTWATRAAATIDQVYGVGCATATTCWAAVWDDPIQGSTGGSFTAQSGADNMWDVSCVAATCWSAGPDGQVATNGSGSWQTTSAGTAAHLRRISCPGPATCFAVGSNGTIVATGATPPPLPCASGTSILDGYVLGAYARLAVDATPGGSTICYQLNAPDVAQSGTIEISGAALTAPLPAVDENAAGCAGANAVPGPHPIVDATFQGSTRVMLDVRTDAGVADVCVQVGSLVRHVRVTVPGVSAPVPGLHPDTPAKAAPARDAGPAGFPSASCTGGTEIVNALVLGNRVKARVTQPNALRLDVCARAATAGGRVSIDLSGVPGAVPTVTQGSTMATCTVPQILVVSPVLLEVNTSAPGLPLSVCVRTAAGVQTYTLSGGSTPNVVPVVQLDPA